MYAQLYTSAVVTDFDIRKMIKLLVEESTGRLEQGFWNIPTCDDFMSKYVYATPDA